LTDLATLPIRLKLERDLLRSLSKDKWFFIGCAMLYDLCKAIRPSLVVETGVADGFSSLFILMALDKNHKGNLHSIEKPDLGYLDGKESGWVVPQVYRRRWHLIIDSSERALPQLLKRLGKIDFFLHDSSHSYRNMFFELCWAWRHLRRGGYLMADGVLESMAFLDFCEMNGIRPSNFRIGTGRYIGLLRKD
jgi:predicted O-methyltransferase YrrM